MPKSWEQMVRDHAAYRRPQEDSAAPTVRWGDEKVLEVAGAATLATGDLLNIELPAPAVCRFWFHAEILSGAGGVQATSLEMWVGNGSQTTLIRRAYGGLPAQGPPPFNADIPIDVTWELPLVNVRGRVALLGNAVAVRFALWMTPIVEVSL